MNRSIVGIAAGMILLAFVLMSFPLWALGAEQFDGEQEAGILFLPFGLMILLVGLTALDPRSTTIGGAFGNAEFDPSPPKSTALPPRTRLAYDPTEDVHCPVLPQYHHCRPHPVSPVRPGAPLPQLRTAARDRPRATYLSRVRSDGSVV